MPGTFTTGRQVIDADRNVWYEYNRATGKLEVAVNGTTVLTCHATDGVDATKLTIGGKAVASGNPVDNIADPSGGETVDDEARTAIASILDALEVYGIMKAAS